MKRCKQTKFIFKTDDDIFIKYIFIIIIFKEKIDHLLKNQYSLFGFPIQYGLVVRHSNNHVGQRYIITKDEYSMSKISNIFIGFWLFNVLLQTLFFSHAYLTRSENHFHYQMFILLDY